MNSSGFDDLDPRQPHRRAATRNAGFRVGLVGGAVMWGVHLFLLLTFGGTNQGDFLAWVIQWFVYYFIGRSAALHQLNVQRHSVYAPLKGVQSAGTGAALITSLLVWLFMLVRGVVRDAYGITVLVDPVGLFFLVIIDISLAMGLGTWAAKAIVDKNRTFDDPF